MHVKKQRKLSLVELDGFTCTFKELVDRRDGSIIKTESMNSNRSLQSNRISKVYLFLISTTVSAKCDAPPSDISTKQECRNKVQL